MTSLKSTQNIITQGITTIIQGTTKRRALFQRSPPQAGTRQEKESETVTQHDQVSSVFTDLINRPDHFTAGQISQFYHNWTRKVREKSRECHNYKPQLS